MKHIADSYIVNKLQQFYTLEPQTQYLFRTNGLAESKLLEKVEETLDRFSDYSYSFLPKSSGVDLRIKAADRKNINPQLLARLRKDIGAYIYSEKEETLAEVISKLMQNNNLTLAVAESFTGGVLSDWITNIPGSSAYYLGGVITYSNDSKITQLGVDQQTLNSFGAVSAETVEEMVRGVQELFKSDCSIASTGIAGPTGATAQKPVGLCYLAACFNDQVQTRKFNFGYNRRIVKERGAAAGLDLLRRLLLAQKDLELI